MNNRCGVNFVKIEETVQIGPVFTRRRKLEILAAETIANGIDQVQAGGVADDILRKGNGSEFCQSDIEILFDGANPLFDEKIKQKTLEGRLPHKIGISQLCGDKPRFRDGADIRRIHDQEISGARLDERSDIHHNGIGRCPQNGKGTQERGGIAGGTHVVSADGDQIERRGISIARRGRQKSLNLNGQIKGPRARGFT